MVSSIPRPDDPLVSRAIALEEFLRRGAVRALIDSADSAADVVRQLRERVEQANSLRSHLQEMIAHVEPPES